MNPKLKQIEITLPDGYAAYFIENIEDISSLACSYFEDEPTGIWTVFIIVNNAEDISQISNRINILSSSLDIPTPEIIITDIENKDWIIESQKYFSPFTIGKFCVHTSWHDKASLPKDFLAIEIDPSFAFGTGTHATTKGCLLALSQLYEQNNLPKNILDMGTGTGILAIAARLLWHDAKIVAVDNDPVAVDISVNNCNNYNINCVLADNFSSKNISSSAPYDLIIANILANPLIELSKGAAESLSLQGKIILSGFYDNQAPMIISAYTQYNLSVTMQYSENNWQTIIMSKTT